MLGSALLGGPLGKFEILRVDSASWNVLDRRTCQKLLVVNRNTGTFNMLECIRNSRHYISRVAVSESQARVGFMTSCKLWEGRLCDEVGGSGLEG